MSDQEQINRLLQDASKRQRKEVDDDVFYKKFVLEQNVIGALERVHELLLGNAKNKTQHRKMLKQKRKDDVLRDFI